MSITYTFFLLHLLSACLWVGGMFFAYFALRPVAANLLEPPLRLPLWDQSFKRFFSWVWAFILILPITGYSMIFNNYQTMANTPISVHIMQLSGWLMIAIFIYIYFIPYKKMQLHLTNSKLPEAGTCLNRIRQLVATNLGLGLFTIIIASTSRFY